MLPIVRASWMATLIVGLALAPAGWAQVASSDHPATILFYPYITVSSAQGVDTIVQLTNESDSLVPVRCVYENANGHCSSSQQVCTAGSPNSCPAGQTCEPGWQAIDFQLTLTRQQPIGWRASEGRISLPCSTPSDKCPDVGGGLIPAIEDPFTGALKCFAADKDWIPTNRNVLTGNATIERASKASFSSLPEAGVPGPSLLAVAPPQFDVAKYNAVGLPASPMVNDDEQLVLGSSLEIGEYAGCPTALRLLHLFDNAHEPVGNDVVRTTLVLIPCTEDFETLTPTAVTVVYDVINEFEEHFQASKAFDCLQVSTLSSISPVFSVATAGTLTGQTRIIPNAQGSGVLAVALEGHGQPNQRQTTAAINVHMEGPRMTADVITLPLGP